MVLGSIKAGKGAELRANDLVHQELAITPRHTGNRKSETMDR